MNGATSYIKHLFLTSVFASIFSAQTLAHAQVVHDPQFPPTGGMWMPSQIPKLEGVLKKLGLEVDPADLSDPTSNTLNAIVSLGGCSGSFISKLGLIVTNWHCVVGYLNYMTGVDKQEGKNHTDHVKNGFFAPTSKDERYAGPQSRVFITSEIIDVTEKITQGLPSPDQPMVRHLEIEKRQKALLKEAEESAPNTKAELKNQFRGEKYFLTKKLELKDLRVVYAPPEAIGFFGGDEKNWEFPRHVGDFALLRVYKGEGSNVEHNAQNTPFVPKNILKIASKPTLPNDLVLVAGYPGRTNRLSTAAESIDEINETIPATISFMSDMKKLFDTLAARSEELRKKTKSAIFSIENTLKKQSEALQILGKINYLEDKKKLQDDLTAWMQSDPALVAQYGQSLEKMEAIRQKYKAGLERRSAISRVFDRSFNPLFSSAMVIVRVAKEREKPDAERLTEYQEREWKDLKDRLKGYQPTYDREIPLDYMSYIIPKVLKTGDAPSFISDAFDLAAIAADPAQLRVQTNALIEGSQLENVEKRLEAFENLTWEAAKSSEDKLIRFAANAVTAMEEIEVNSKSAAAENIYTKDYAQVLRLFLKSRGQEMAPDANSSLRVTFGQVKGYSSAKYQRNIPAFTNLRDLFEKELKWGKKDFELPTEWMRAYEKAKVEGYGPYADPIYSELPLNFVANVDTTGGNSGSAALNGRGELIGLLFDGNSESLYGDYKFDAKVRSALVDIRYMLWTLDEIVNAQDLLVEVGAKEAPAVPAAP